MELKDYKGVWVFCEQRGGELTEAARELLSEGRRLADQLHTELTGLLPGGSGIAGKASEAGSYGADQVIVAEDDRLAVYNTDPYAALVCELVEKYKPEVFLIGATNVGRDLAPRCAARLHTGLCADCTHLDVDTETYQDFLRKDSMLAEARIAGTGTASVRGEKKDVSRELKMTRPAFGGNLMASIICPSTRPAMATVRPGVMQKAEPSEERAGRVRVIVEKPVFEEDQIRTEVLKVVESVGETIDLTEARYIVSVGRGIAADVEKGLALARSLADSLGGEVAGSRAAVDNGWIPADRQVGQTGKTVRPVIYIALGISGAIQHKIGMMDADCIIAVNRDKTAPIFEIADYGITGDLFSVAPILTGVLRDKRG